VVPAGRAETWGRPDVASRVRLRLRYCYYCCCSRVADDPRVKPHCCQHYCPAHSSTISTTCCCCCWFVAGHQHHQQTHTCCSPCCFECFLLLLLLVLADGSGRIHSERKRFHRATTIRRLVAAAAVAVGVVDPVFRCFVVAVERFCCCFYCRHYHPYRKAAPASRGSWNHQTRVVVLYC